MRKLFFLILFELFFIGTVFCDPIDTTTAKTVATNFFVSRISQSNQARVKRLATQKLEVELVHQEFDDSILINKQANKEPYYYVYNVKGNNGFIIVSADDAVMPILGYAFEGKYDNINQPPAFINWMKNYKKQIKYIKASESKSISSVKSEWSKNLIKNLSENENGLNEVAPLLTSKWNQGCYYNSYCPQDVKGQCGRVWTGCVATAMGQIINYWKYPDACNEIPGYMHHTYGWIEGIKATAYDWPNMSNELIETTDTTHINAVAKLLYNCGVSVKMNYGVDGSGSASSFAAEAYSKYFKYSSSVQYIQKADNYHNIYYTDTEWKDLIKNELNHNRPVQYGGDNSGYHAHSFVCDGYQNSDYFHFNWGWGGALDGYFTLNNLHPGGDFKFNDDMDIIIGISNVPIPVLNYSSHKIIDNGIDGSLGNGNGITEPGEMINLPITLVNNGSGSANNVKAVISTTDSSVTINDSIKNIGTIMVDSIKTSASFKFTVSSACTDKDVAFTLKITSDEGSWTKVFNIHVYKVKKINIDVAGKLKDILTTTELKNTTFLAVTGEIDARDFKIMRDSMPVLAMLDISAVSIKAYTGSEGTGNTNATYSANTIPCYSFYNPNTYTGKKILNSVIFPSSITVIDYFAFYNCTGLSGVLDIPTSVTDIKYYAFSDCSNLASVLIPLSVTSIGSRAFYNCSGSIIVDTNNPNYSSSNSVLYNKVQTTIIQCPISKNGNFTIPSTVTTIGNDAFDNCRKLTSVVIPSTVTSIGDGAFNYCKGLTSVNIPSSVTAIKSGTFNYCSGLTSINIPSSVTSIGISAFSYCSGSVNVDANNPNYSSIDGVLYNKAQTKLMQCPTSKHSHFNIPSSVISIEDAAFSGCTDLSSVTIPSSVISVGRYAFSECKQLTSIIIPSSVTSIASNTFMSCDFLASVTIPSSVTSIGDGSFRYCSSLNSIIIPSSVTFVGSSAFAYCYNLTSIYTYPVIPVNLTSSSAVFAGVNKTTCTLYVPTGSKVAYQAADQWKDFTNIVEMTTAVQTVDDVKINLYPNPVIDGFQIKDIEGTSELIITNLNGKVLLSKQVIGNENVSINEFPAGVYIINLSNNGVSYQKKVIKK